MYLFLIISVFQLNFLPRYVIETGILDVCSKKKKVGNRNRESEASRGLTKACGDKPVHLLPNPNPLSVTAA